MEHSSLRRMFIFLANVGLASACGSPPETSTPIECTASETQTCTGESGCLGYQKCQEGGAWQTSCVCFPPENCQNSVDDDNDGLRDCDDADCSDSICIPQLPDAEPVFLFYLAPPGASEDQLPDCPWGGETLSVAPYVIPPAACPQCFCNLPSDVKKEAAIQFYLGAGCTQLIETNLATADSCFPTSSSPQVVSVRFTPKVQPGNCDLESNGSVLRPPLEFSSLAKSCWFKDIGYCQSGTCVEPPSPPFEICRYRDGDVDCPEPFTKRAVVYNSLSFTDTRDCTPCSCGPYTVNLYAGFYTDFDCMDSYFGVDVDGLCHDASGILLGSSVIQSQGFDCTLTAPMPTGDVTLPAPRTVCCLTM